MSHSRKPLMENRFWAKDPLLHHLDLGREFLHSDNAATRSNGEIS